jgi:anaerobic selenocysteine-containing dehydrogenase
MCSVLITVEDGRISEFRGDPDHPFTRGFLCKKMRDYPEKRVHSKHRITRAMIRSGKKGSGEFRNIPLAEALDLTAERLKGIRSQYGPASILPYSYAGNMGLLSRFSGFPFFHRYGALRLKQTICSSTASEAWRLHYGEGPGSDPETARHADLIIAWGADIRTTNPHFWPIVSEARRSGARLVVIDPHRTATAKGADHHIPVLPSGDCALVSGVMRLLIEQDGLDSRFIADHTEGFDEWRIQIMSHSIEEYARISGTSLSDMNLLARLILDSKRTFLRIGTGPSRNTRGGVSIRAIACMAAALGLFDGTPGKGALLYPNAFQEDRDHLKRPDLMTANPDSFNMNQLGEALTVREPDVKGLFVYNSNPALVAPDRTRVIEGLLREDLFTVVHDQVMTQTAKYADILLPATVSYENHDLYISYGHFSMMATAPVLSAPGEAISNHDLFRELARRFGYTEEVFTQSAEEAIRRYLSTVRGLPVKADEILPGVIYRSLFADAKRTPFKTRNGLFSFTGTDGATGAPSLIRALEFEDELLQKKYPFRLITPPSGDTLNSTFAELSDQVLESVLIHPEDADRLRIVDGATIKLYNDRGSLLGRAVIDTDTMRGVLIAHKPVMPNAENRYTSINNVTSARLSDIGEGSTFHESLVGVSPLS